jgi:FtsZ-binding cell division protein ZapB
LADPPEQITEIHTLRIRVQNLETDNARLRQFGILHQQQVTSLVSENMRLRQQWHRFEDMVRGDVSKADDRAPSVATMFFELDSQSQTIQQQSNRLLGIAKQLVSSLSERNGSLGAQQSEVPYLAPIGPSHAPVKIPGRNP